MPMHRTLPFRTHPYILLFIVAWMLLSFITSPYYLHAQSQSSLRVMKVDTSRAPQIEITVDYTLANGQPTTSAPQFRVQSANKPLTVSGVERKRIPINVAIVTDLSARMSDQGAPYTTRFQNMLPLVQDLVSQLQASTNYVSLVTVSESVRLPHPLTNDLQAIVNTLNRGNPDLIFEPLPLRGANPDAEYPLYEGIRNGIAQLVTGEVRPRVLVIFASGGIESSAMNQIREEIDLARANNAPIKVLIFSFGSESSYTTFPAATTALDDLALELNGTLIDIGSELPSIQTRALIDAQFDAVLQRGEQWVITANAGNVPAGTATIQVEADGTLGEYTFENPAVAPSVSVTASTTSWQGEVILTVNEQIAQAPITKVQYLLDNYPIGESTLASNGYAHTLDSTVHTFLKQFPPGEHSLVAAITDERGMQSRSEPITVTVLEAPGPNWADYWWVLLLLVVIVVLAVVSIMVVRNRHSTGSSKVPTKPVYIPPPPVAEEEPTTRHSEPDPRQTQVLNDDDEATKRLEDDEKTARLNSGGTSSKRWTLHILEGADRTTHDLQGQRHYDLGRPARNHHPHIPINNSLVSRTHATLERLVNGLELVPLETENGTFLGEERRPLKANERVQLQSGDVFWLSPQVKLRVESHS
ncbi:FHA domain-containing protein [Candidatus Oscillochloris fontis]|uniref:FHA domain-containing protein n=1 Tax=Candidatus Oscillochloris fontis TaxID=2496868 RepID=UPI00101C17CD|nr:FHA domain-containing protein [Candidatus Oscillochloris fontis]